MNVHVHSSDGEAKFWLDPQIELAKNYRLSRQQLHKIENIIVEHYEQLKNAWRSHFTT